MQLNFIGANWFGFEFNFLLLKKERGSRRNWKLSFVYGYRVCEWYVDLIIGQAFAIKGKFQFFKIIFKTKRKKNETNLFC